MCSLHNMTLTQMFLDDILLPAGEVDRCSLSFDAQQTVVWGEEILVAMLNQPALS